MMGVGGLQPPIYGFTHAHNGVDRNINDSIFLCISIILYR